MLVTKSFDRYLLTYVGGTSLQGGEPGADINCYQANSRVGLLRFFRDGATMPANKVLSDGSLALYYEMSRFNDVITTLRFEKPLMLVVNSDTGFGYICSATLEPVGEQEGV
jgi:hypothetical protein